MVQSAGYELDDFIANAEITPVTLEQAEATRQGPTSEIDFPVR